MFDIFPLQFLLVTWAGWVNRRQLEVIAYAGWPLPCPGRGRGFGALWLGDRRVAVSNVGSIGGGANRKLATSTSRDWSVPIEPAPERQRRTTWPEFLKTHWDVLAAADFFTVEAWTSSGLTPSATASTWIRPTT